MCCSWLCRWSSHKFEMNGTAGGCSHFAMSNLWIHFKIHVKMSWCWLRRYTLVGIPPPPRAVAHSRYKSTGHIASIAKIARKSPNAVSMNFHPNRVDGAHSIQPNRFSNFDVCGYDGTVPIRHKLKRTWEKTIRFPQSYRIISSMEMSCIS